MKIPVIINNRDTVTWIKAMVDRIKKYDNVGDIIILDNGSTYEPLLDWYKTKPCEIIMRHNIGCYGVWNSGILNNINTEYYVATDSDLGLEDTPDDTLNVLMEKLRTHENMMKIGLGLDWEIVLPESPYYNHMQGYEKSRWLNSEIIDEIYTGVAIDTTFAIYNISSKNSFIGGGSLTKPYVAKHYPWYYTHQQRNNDEEFSYYIRNANYGSSYKRFLVL